ncbi:hypothetical protein FV222_01485 [Methylobacterium sp. WL103]|uniref:ATP-dependent DNA ligase n=1 Tax=Methylobacterium sp. WL103 TaxID=2603891 RepID=UPI0011C704CD|nr:hypothetical protein [Methylobacterium sp. WL103]TXN07937.1 hypothetical protein FV222_01485 [Methylobacterium sp. WL103]
MNSNDVLKLLIQIDNTSSRTAKEDLLREHIGDELVRQVVTIAYDPFITFGITPPEPPTTPGTRSFGGDDPQPWIMLHQLSKRELTGNAAKIAVERMLADLDGQSAALLWRMLRKDLRCGITEKTINTVLPGTVPTFDVMLSKPFEAKRVKAWPVAVEPKLDGLRALCIVKDGTGKFFSRVGNHFPALDHLGPGQVSMVQAAWETAKREQSTSRLVEVYYKLLGGDAGPSLALDSEITAGSFNKTSGDVKRKSEQAKDSVINLFDALPAKQMLATDTPEIKIPFKIRRGFAQWVRGFAPKDHPIVMTDLRTAKSVEEIEAIYDEHRAAGLEGAMVKPFDASYVKKKGFLWMKMKNESTEDLRVVGAFEGEGKYVGSLGGLIVDRAGVQVRVGGGFSDAQRREIWDDFLGPVEKQARVLGRLIEVEYHEVTPDGSLRHPRFVRWRDDKDEQLKVAA